MNYKMEIKLTGKLGGIAIVSPEDYELVSQYKWHNTPKGYAIGKIGNKMMRMNRFIMNDPKGKVIDHINRNKLDNRRENLRIYTTLQNGQNKSIKKTKTTSIYRGVSYYESSKKYRGRFVYNKIHIDLGDYMTELEAAIAFDKYIVNNKIEEIELNFPDKREEYIDDNYEFVKRKFTSKYNGVIFNKQDKKYYAKIISNKKNTYICSSEDEIECAKA